MLQVKFYDTVEDKIIKFAVIVSKYQGKWVFCKHKERTTYECPGGHREEGEAVIDTAKRELYEETGAIEYSLSAICVYSVCGYDGIHKNIEENFGMLYFADIKSFGELPQLEIEKVELFEELPDRWTYPLIQPKLIEKINSAIFSKELEQDNKNN